ncbi:MAG: dTDP-4-dehydrorhamnose 3,5-epimerase [Flavobacteriales bacterium]
MIVSSFHIEGPLLIEPKVYRDERGYFMESFHEERFTELTEIKHSFKQDNESFSSKGVLRGLHFQVPPKAQAKLVRVASGSVMDVIVDLRTSSPTFGQHLKVMLSGENKHQLYIPEGFAHGFLTLQDNTLFCYKCSEFYHSESEKSLKWDDPDLLIDWDYSDPIVSTKDQNAGLLADFNSPFE